MNDKPLLHILFTMDCEPVTRRAAKTGPKTWELSARAIEGFCDRLSSAGYPTTLFVSAECAEEHGPLMEELVARGIEVGLHVHPPSLGGERYTRHLGQYRAEEQRAIVEEAVERFYDAVGIRPRSFRSGAFSASDATFLMLYQLGFRQGSLSIPGRDLPRDAVCWSGAEIDTHYVDPSDRLRAGDLPFLELPVTSDPNRYYRQGHPSDLRIENSTVDDWHRPLIEQHLNRLATANAAFRTLCLYTQSGLAYYKDDDRHSVTVEKLLDYFDALADQYELAPTTLAGAHERFRQLIAEMKEQRLEIGD
jgi:peptidoglycan/xylan/chitin deacetylase (PgdA/CDA1 family)